jgi:hypothetical protein
VPGSANPKRVAVFERSDLAPELQQPLSATLSPKAPSLKTVRRSPDLAAVDQLTRTFGFTIRSDTPDSYMLVLSRLKTPPKKPAAHK